MLQLNFSDLLWLGLKLENQLKQFGCYMSNQPAEFGVNQQYYEWDGQAMDRAARMSQVDCTLTTTCVGLYVWTKGGLGANQALPFYRIHQNEAVYLAACEVARKNGAGSQYTYPSSYPYWLPNFGANTTRRVLAVPTVYAESLGTYKYYFLLSKRPTEQLDTQVPTNDNF
jgi:hypothetical protein